MFQSFQPHPLGRGLIEGGELVSYGARAIEEGGWYAMPRLYTAGCMLVGESAGLLNSMRLKGIHLGMKSGMLAAETALEALRAKSSSAADLAAYEASVRSSWIGAELYKARNFRQAFDRGFFWGMVHTGLQMITGGRGLIDPLPIHPGYTRMQKIADRYGSNGPLDMPPKYDGALTFDKLSDLYRSGTRHEENQPVHLHVSDTNVCATRCVEEYGNPCQRFCPASVYEMVADPAMPHGKRLMINFANCVHCKTCDIADPYQIITWVTPEGGGGPMYKKT
jgi:electron-transferring-flavoprotein dehydrogenase